MYQLISGIFIVKINDDGKLSITIFNLNIIVGLGLVRLDNGCTCPGQVVVYDCTVNGSETIATVWKGSALDCPENGNVITLLHSQYSDKTFGVCNNRTIVAQGVPPSANSNGTFTSRLSVIVSSSLDGKSIVCGEDNGVETKILQNDTLRLTTGLL